MNQINHLTQAHHEIMLECVSGATIWGYPQAMLLREVERYDKELLTIFPLKELEAALGEAFDEAEQLPYFGAILTDKGREAVNEYFRAQNMIPRDNLS